MKTSNNEPRIYTSIESIGDSQLTFEGEQYTGNPILDTRVKFNGVTLCWISWKDKESFANEFNLVIEKYRI